MILRAIGTVGWAEICSISGKISLQVTCLWCCHGLAPGDPSRWHLFWLCFLFMVLRSWNGYELAPIDIFLVNLFSSSKFPFWFAVIFTYSLKQQSIHFQSWPKSSPSPSWHQPLHLSQPWTHACPPSSTSNTVLTMANFGIKFPRRTYTTCGTLTPPVLHVTSTPSRRTRETRVMLLASFLER